MTDDYFNISNGYAVDDFVTLIGTLLIVHWLKPPKNEKRAENGSMYAKTPVIVDRCSVNFHM